MRYYLAREQNTPPYVVFDRVADNLEELVEKGLENSGLVVEEDRLLDKNRPDYINYDYGECSVKIQNGKLVAADKSLAEQNFAKSLEIAKTQKAYNSMRGDVFRYDGHDFPMTEGAVRFYNALFSTGVSTSIEVISLSGGYILLEENLDAFKAAYNSKVLNLYSLQRAPG